MKRCPELLELSREHHTALKISRHARLAAESGQASELQRLAGQVTGEFANELEPHFRVEEDDLLPRLAAAGEAALVARTQTEHRELRDLVRQLQTPDAGTLRRFAELLADHVRFEERELFETAQRVVDWND